MSFFVGVLGFNLCGGGSRSYSLKSGRVFGFEALDRFVLWFGVDVERFERSFFR